MRIAIVIPAFNEEDLIGQTLESIAQQSFLPQQVIVVDDNSTDRTFDNAQSYSDKLPLSVIRNTSTAENIPGSKVIKAFNKGLELLELDEFDIICKFDADLVFPYHYLDMMLARFRESEKIGMAAGHCSILKNGQWVLEDQNNPDHIRGALKAYRVACFKDIGGLKTSIGWDTMDEMLARYKGWQVTTIEGLWVKHLKPTGAAYRKKAMRLQGEAFYKMRYGLLLTTLTALKMTVKQRKPSLFTDYLKGYFQAQKKGLEPLLNKDQGQFLRNYRWKAIQSKFGY